MKSFKRNIMKFGKKIGNIIKRKLIVNLYVIKISKSWKKKSTQNKAFHVILIDSVYKKYENYYPKVFLEKYDFNDSFNVDIDKKILMILMVLMKKIQ